MQYLYFIGNGFDLAQNLETSYKDFIKYYLIQPSKGNAIIEKLKKDIEREEDSWGYFEKKFGEYTTNFKDDSEYHIAMDDVRDKMEVFLTEKQNSYVPKEGSRKLIDDFFNPLQYFPVADREKIDNEKNNYVDIVTLNYTNIIETYCKNNFPIQKEKNSLFSNQMFAPIHIHGELGGTILFGVNDKTQISNPKLSESSDVLAEFVKPEANESMHNTINRDVSNLIVKADVIVIYGTALGETDDKWWKRIGERVSKGKTKLMYFVKSDYKHNPRKQYLYGIEYNRQLDFLCERLGISSVKEAVRDKILIAPNSNMFVEKK